VSLFRGSAAIFLPVVLYRAMMMLRLRLLMMMMVMRIEAAKWHF
jgi:hypothetical protein